MVRAKPKRSRFVAEGGFYIISVLWNASTYSHHGKQYQCVTITPEDVKTMYRKLGFQLMHLETTQLDDIYYGYIMACGCRRG